MAKMQDIYERFWRKVDRINPFGPKGDCWRWLGPPQKSGYALFSLPGGEKMAYAHRLSYEFSKGKIPKNLQIRHLCGVRLCVNPRHMLLGTAKDNARDRDWHGKTRRGVNHWKAKLNDTKVREIRILYASGRYSEATLGKRYGVDQSMISAVVLRKFWRHVS